MLGLTEVGWRAGQERALPHLDCAALHGDLTEEQALHLALQLSRMDDTLAASGELPG